MALMMKRLATLIGVWSEHVTSPLRNRDTIPGQPRTTTPEDPSASRRMTDRERGLWTWTLVVVVAIYSTLGLTPTILDELRDRNLIAGSFALGMVLIAAAIVSLSLRIRPKGAEIGVALGVAAVYVLMLLRLAIPEERSHLIEYSIVAVLIHQALLERASHGRHVPLPALFAVAATSLLGILDELIQGVLPNRVFDVRDIGFNVLAGVMAIGASRAVARVRRRAATGGDAR